MIKTLIVDDEPPTRRRMRRFIAGENDLQLVGESGDSEDALSKIRELQPDLVFLDIKLPGMSGLELARMLQSGPAPHIVFVTGYGQYALEAFNINAIDYLVKPFDEERFHRAVDKVRTQLRTAQAATRSTQDMAGLVSLLGKLPGGSARGTRRFAVKQGTRVKLLDLDKLTYVRSDGNYLHIHRDGGERVLIRENMGRFLEKLDGPEFMRISRSVILNLAFVLELTPKGHGDYEFLMKSGDSFLSGPTYRRKVRELLAELE